MNRMVVVLMAAGFAMLFASSAGALSNVTIADEIANNTFGGGATGVGGEDQEVEHGMVNNQSWDLEAFIWDATSQKLTIVGGYNFKNGNDGWKSGDLFLADSTPKFGEGAHAVSPATTPPTSDGTTLEIYGYDLALDLNWDSVVGNTVSYNVMGLTPNSTLELAVYNEQGYNPGSNPYRYLSNGDNLASGSATLGTVADGTYGLTGGGQHYTLTFDLSNAAWLDAYLKYDPTADLWTHFTMGCGNDNLMGQIPDGAVPEPVTMVMLGCLGAGMLGSRKLSQRKKA